MKQDNPDLLFVSDTNVRTRRVLPMLTGISFLAIVGTSGMSEPQPFRLLVSSAAAAQEQAFASIERTRGLPIRGQTRDSVRKKYGEPVSRKGAVGQPPISSWRYADFTVYFEYDRVITTVAEQDSLPMSLGGIQ